MRTPEHAPDVEAILRGLLPSERALRWANGELHPEVKGKYLHWDELRRHFPLAGATHEEMWAGIAVARRVVRMELPLLEHAGRRFFFSRTESLLKALHRIDGEVGRLSEVTGRQAMNPDVRNRYVIRSLMEEAITSSQLEGASTTRRVAKDMLEQGRPPRDSSERMIFNNFHAMDWARRRAEEPLDIASLLELHETVTQGTLGPGEEGRFRRADEPVTVQDRGSGDVLHIPPDARELPDRLEAFCAFANEAEGGGLIHPVVRAIVLHFALAYDHPFVDGNGRTARALFYWSMIRQGYWMAEFLSISRIIQKGPARYSRAFLFTETDGGDLTYFLLHQLDVIHQALRDLYEYLDHKGQEQREEDRLVGDAAKFNHRQRHLLAHALRHPTARYEIAPYQRQHGVVYQTARQDLLDLEKAGLLKKGRVDRAFVFTPVAHLERALKKHRNRKRG